MGKTVKLSFKKIAVNICFNPSFWETRSAAHSGTTSAIHLRYGGFPWSMGKLMTSATSYGWFDLHNRPLLFNTSGRIYRWKLRLISVSPEQKHTNFQCQTDSWSFMQLFFCTVCSGEICVFCSLWIPDVFSQSRNLRTSRLNHLKKNVKKTWVIRYYMHLSLESKTLQYNLWKHTLLYMKRCKWMQCYCSLLLKLKVFKSTVFFSLVCIILSRDARWMSSEVQTGFHHGIK